MQLKTRRLILREWKYEDIPDLIEGLNDLEVSKWLAFVPHPYTKNDAEDWINCCIKKSENSDERFSYNFAIELKSENKVIGGLGLDPINRNQGIAGGGIWLNAKYHGHGYGTEAFGEKIRFAFEDLRLRRLENGFFEGNIASLQMQKKFGYKEEGVKRKSIICKADGKIHDEHMLGLLKEEWIKLL